MDEADDWDDELPSITVNSSGRDSILFSMPSAEVLASQRAREAECERELRSLAEEHAEQLAGEPLEAAAGACDSSSSEGEGALSAAVRQLQMSVPAATDPAPAPVLLASLLRCCPYDDSTFLASYLQAIQLTPNATQLISDNILDEVMCMLSCENQEWDSCELACVCAWLCACVCSGACSSGVDVRRALHCVLDLLSDTQCVSICSWLRAACDEPTQLLALRDACDAARDTPLGAALLRDALHLVTGCDLLLQDKTRPLSAGSLLAALAPCWPQLRARPRYLAVQAAARLLRGGAGGGAGAERARLLALLARPPLAADRHQPDYLKVLVGASKLQLLFCSKNKT